MGSRKRLSNQRKKEEKSQKVLAFLRNYPSSPRKMRLVADIIRGKSVVYALSVLEYTKNHASDPLKKLVLSALENWKKKHKEEDKVDLYIAEIKVDTAGMLKRMRPAPQGRGHRIRKRSNHVSLEIERVKKSLKEQV